MRSRKRGEGERIGKEKGGRRRVGGGEREGKWGLEGGWREVILFILILTFNF